MRGFLNQVIRHLRGRVDYGDVRVIESETETIVIKNGIVEGLKRTRTQGFGVRVLKSSGWGFGSSAIVKDRNIGPVVRQAIAIATASRQASRPVRLTPVPPVKDSYRTEYRTDPFRVKLDNKIKLLFEVNEILKEKREVSLAVSLLSFIKERKFFASTEGSYIDQEILHSSGMIRAYARPNGELQVRSYHNSGQAGYEFIEGLRLKDNAERVVEELGMLLKAKPCPAGNRTLILDQDQMALQIHESIGHATELDRILGTEASYAGTSFLKITDLGVLNYGAKIVNVVADARIKAGLGSFGYDDEGVKARRVKLIEDGILVGFQSSRETAPIIGQGSSGAMRADGWNRIPLIRMTNINLLPGQIPYEELVAEVKDGVLMSTNRSWSIDDRRLNFHFGCEIGFRIRKGRITDVYRNPVYTGITPIFWSSCNGIGDRNSWRLIGIMNCGKGEPGQMMRVGHGTSPARFTNVQIGSD